MPELKYVVPRVSYFVAEIEDTLVGYAKLKRKSRQKGVTGDNPIELCRLYNFQEFIGKGVGKATGGLVGNTNHNTKKNSAEILVMSFNTTSFSTYDKNFLATR